MKKRVIPNLHSAGEQERDLTIGLRELCSLAKPCSRMGLRIVLITFTLFHPRTRSLSRPPSANEFGMTRGRDHGGGGIERNNGMRRRLAPTSRILKATYPRVYFSFNWLTAIILITALGQPPTNSARNK